MIGIMIENSSEVTIKDCRFSGIAQPIVAKNVTGLIATGNVATYSKPPSWIGWMRPYPEIPVSKLKVEALFVRWLYAGFRPTLGGKK